jgi:hypothetical protein
LGKIAYRLNLLAGFFLPLVSIGGLLGMNVDFPYFIRPLFWIICIGGLFVGGLLLWLVGRQTGDSKDQKLLADVGRFAVGIGKNVLIKAKGAAARR